MLSAISLEVLGSAGSDSTLVHTRCLIISLGSLSLSRDEEGRDSPGQLAEAQDSLVGQVADVNLHPREKDQDQTLHASWGPRGEAGGARKLMETRWITLILTGLTS